MKFISTKELKKMRKRKNVFHICGLYEKGDRLKNVKIQDGRTVNFGVTECFKCKKKVKYTIGKEVRKPVCPDCVLEIMGKRKKLEFLTHKDNKILHDILMEKIGEEELLEELKKGENVAG